jgi:membrane protease YdiL (CAAX protease family)
MVEPTTPVIVLVNLILVSAVTTWIIIALRLWRGQPLLRYEPRRPVPWDWIDLLLAIVIYLGSQVICVGIALAVASGGVDIKGFSETTQGQVALLGGVAVALIITLVLCLVLLVARSNANYGDLGFALTTIPRDTVYGVIAFLAAAPVVYVIQAVFIYVVKIEYNHPLIKSLQDKKDPMTIAIVTFTAVIAAPLVEEFLFRVVLQGWLEKLETKSVERGQALSATNLSEPTDLVIEVVAEPSSVHVVSQTPTTGLFGLPLGSTPILISSLLFALVHVGQGAAPIPLFVYALVLGYLYQMTHRIWPSVVAHFALNSVSMLMLFISPMPAAN